MWLRYSSETQRAEAQGLEAESGVEVVGEGQPAHSKPAKESGERCKLPHQSYLPFWCLFTLCSFTNCTCHLYVCFMHVCCVILIKYDGDDDDFRGARWSLSQNIILGAKGTELVPANPQGAVPMMNWGPRQKLRDWTPTQRPQFKPCLNVCVCVCVCV